MARSKTVPRDVATVRNAGDLLTAVGAPRLRPEAAVDQGLLVREKIEGLWIYAADVELIETAQEEMEILCAAAAAELLLAHIQVVAGRARQQVTCTLHPQAAQQILKALLRQGALGGLGQLNQYYDPYVVVHAPEDAEDVRRIVGAAIDRLVEDGEVTSDQLPEPLHHRQSQAWREAVLRHLEFLGQGRYEGDRVIRAGS